MKQLLFLILSLSLVSADDALSLKLEAKRAIKIGVNYLLENQKDAGYWSDPETPALTSLVLTAYMRDPNKRDVNTPEITKAYQWIYDQQQADGGIYRDGLATYNTAISIMALLARDEPADRDTIIKARHFLIGQQSDWDEQGQTDNQYDGGVGYGGTYKHSDLSNTHLALEALYHSRQIALDYDQEERKQLNWKDALTFISRCQNLQETNDQQWASNDAQNKGGFVYFPGDSKAGSQSLSDGTNALRSYGSMTYAGLLSLIHADLSPQDPRVGAALDWLSAHFSVEENPGMEQQGLYYYYQAMAKSLAASGTTYLETKNASIDWRRKLVTKLVSTQKSDGSWINETSRWWENDPILVTAYAVLALQQVHATYR